MDIKISGSGLSAQFSKIGAELQSLRDQNHIEYIWQANPSFWNGHAPILFPNVGSLRHKKAIISGNNYPLPKHGIVRRREFIVAEHTSNSVTFLFCSNPETKIEYPFDFNLRVTYRIEENILYQAFKVTNTDTKVLPFVLGGHPAFNCPLYSGENFEDYVIQFEKVETLDCPRVNMGTGMIDMSQRYSALISSDTIPLQHSLFENDAMIFESPRSKKIRLINPSTKKGVEMDFDGFKYIAVWSQADEDTPFVALEPWLGCGDCYDEDGIFEHKRGMVHLNSGEDFSIGFTVKIL